MNEFYWISFALTKLEKKQYFDTVLNKVEQNYVRLSFHINVWLENEINDQFK